MVNNNVVTVYGARWGLDISGEHFVKYILSNHCANHLKLIQTNMECKL